MLQAMLKKCISYYSFIKVIYIIQFSSNKYVSSCFNKIKNFKLINLN